MPNPKPRAPLVSVQAGYPMQMVATDILGPLPESSSGNSYILVAADYFTQWVEAYPIPSQEAVVVARRLVNEMFCRFSPPEQLHSDQGRQFESHLLAEECTVESPAVSSREFYLHNDVTFSHFSAISDACVCLI